jgi:hypothetical protein
MHARSFPATSDPISMLAKVGMGLSKLLSWSWDGPAKKYQPEDHYMRGPGQKWHEKHGSDRAASFAQVPLVLSDKWDL